MSLLAAALILTIFGAAHFGGEKLPFFETLCALAGGDCGLSAQQNTILFDLRLPRILLGATVGAALATAGASYQALLRNPLAEPYLLGVSNGAALGTMFAFVFLPDWVFARPLTAFAGAMAVSFAVYQLGRGKIGASPERLILAGVIATTFLSSAIVFLTTLLDATRLRTFTFWLLGDLSSANAGSLGAAMVAVVVGTVVLTTQARALNLLMLGESDAFDFGVEVGRTRVVVFTIASALVGFAVAASGSVGYVGLVVPHWIRLALGSSDNRVLIPASAFVGAMFVVAADSIARAAFAPRELPVGAVTALIGAPLFVYLLGKSRL